ncbi:MAG TPA: RelA/SpoT family protein [Chromatiales bacterium]|nr:RelA/SpoT family protein [Chromatiales bacterium]
MTTVDTSLDKFLESASRPATGSTSSERFLISDLCALLESYLEPEKVKKIYSAYLFGAHAHEGQTRMTGEPYIYHPLAVARTMAEMRMDAESIMAAILHDVIEDTPTAREHIAESFGEEVATLVDGVSKLTHLDFESRAEAQAASFRKMMLAMTTDIRVILVKLADRLHNMRTLAVMRPEKRRRIARETLDIYAPIAQRLGMNAMRRELELRSFEAMHPMRYRILSAAVDQAKRRHRELMQTVETTIVQRLEEHGIHARISGREKNLYSIYRKMRDKHLSFNEVYDVFAIRIVVDNIDTCYRVLGLMHTLYKPLDRFKDYIAIPKANGYQSLHTTLFGPKSTPIEIQIRTEDMEHIAEEGIAAHWHYKSGEAHSSAAQQRAHEWLKSMVELQQNTGNALEFLENVKVDLFPDEVYVFTPNGKIMTLPRGATGVDFAYAVHTDIGDSCVAVRVDKKILPPSEILENGQTVEVITEPGAYPNPAWLNFIVTARARSSIRHRLRTLEDDQAIILGKRMLNRALKDEDSSIEKLLNHHIKKVIKQYHCDDFDCLLREIGLGNRVAALIARELLGKEKGWLGKGKSWRIKKPRDWKWRKEDAPLVIKGTEGMVLTFARCCSPVPGDPIVGMISSGKGMVIHQENCPNAKAFRNRRNRNVAVQWAEHPEGEYSATIRVITMNQRGVLARMATEISAMQANIEQVDVSERDAMSTQVTFTVSVHDRKHLADIMRRLRGIKEVMKINRVMG